MAAASLPKDLENPDVPLGFKSLAPPILSVRPDPDEQPIPLTRLKVPLPVEDAVAAFDLVGLSRRNYRVLALLPLVYVAWADGAVHPAQRRLILRTGWRHGMLAFGGAVVLGTWLLERPSPETFETGFALLVELARCRHGIAMDVDAETLLRIVGLCRDVARAGRVLGRLRPYGDAENEAIQTVTERLCIDDGLSWQQLVNELG